MVRGTKIATSSGAAVQTLKSGGRTNARNKRQQKKRKKRKSFGRESREAKRSGWRGKTLITRVATHTHTSFHFPALCAKGVRANDAAPLLTTMTRPCAQACLPGNPGDGEGEPGSCHPDTPKTKVKHGTIRHSHGGMQIESSKEEETERRRDSV